MLIYQTKCVILVLLIEISSQGDNRQINVYTGEADYEHICIYQCIPVRCSTYSVYYNYSLED